MRRQKDWSLLGLAGLGPSFARQCLLSPIVLSSARVQYYQYYQDNAGRSRARTQLSPAESSTTSITRIARGDAGRKPSYAQQSHIVVIVHMYMLMCMS